MVIPAHLVAFAEARGEEGRRWLARLPELVAELVERWGIDLDPPLGDPPGAAAWLAPGRLSDGTPVVLKVAWPHDEARTEAAGLRWFDGRRAVRLLAAHEPELALLLERVVPGDDLWTLDVDAAAEVAAEVLEGLWRPAEGATGIGALDDTVDAWCGRLQAGRPGYPDEVVLAAVDRARELAASQPGSVVLHGDLNPSNVLRSAVDGWVAIDPKPLVGDPAFDLAQYLGNRVDEALTASDPVAELVRQIDGFADRLALDRRRVAGWAAVKAVAWGFGVDHAVLFGRIDAALA